MGLSNQITFTEIDVETDGNQYESCTFNDCKLVFRGGPIPVMNNCQFNGGGWFFEDAAGRTVSLIKEFADNVYPELIQEVFGRPIQ